MTRDELYELEEYLPLLREAARLAEHDGQVCRRKGNGTRHETPAMRAKVEAVADAYRALGVAQSALADEIRREIDQARSARLAGRVGHVQR